MKHNNSLWSIKAKQLTKELHNEISLNNNSWHKFRASKERRSAELIMAAMSQIINNGDDIDVENLLNQAILWIKEDIKDPGCNNH